DLTRQYTGKRLDQELAQQEREILKTLIDDLVLKQRAASLGIVPEIELIKCLDEIRREQGFNDLESLERSLLTRGIEPNQLKHDLEQQLLKRLLRADADREMQASNQAAVYRSAKRNLDESSSALVAKDYLPAKQNSFHDYIQRLRRSSIIEVKHGSTDTGVAYTNDLNRDLLIAARIGDAPKIRALMAQGANPNTVGAKGYSGLMHAAELGHKDSVGVLLDAGAHPNAKSHSGDTALTLATIEGYQDIVKALLARE